MRNLWYNEVHGWQEDQKLGFCHAEDDPNIAFHLNVSIRKIENDFSATYGHALRDEIAAQRLDLICTALRTSNEPIKALVSRSGFGNMSQATRAFKQRFGLTMNEYRASL